MTSEESLRGNGEKNAITNMKTVTFREKLYLRRGGNENQDGLVAVLNEKRGENAAQHGFI